MLLELTQFVGYFLAIGAIGFRFGIVRRLHGQSDEARAILRADNAAGLGTLGVLLLALNTLAGPAIEVMTAHKTWAEALPKRMVPFEIKLAMLALALIGFQLVRRSRTLGWWIAAVGVLVVTLLPVYTGRVAGRVNAFHILAASTWLGTLLVLTVVGVGGLMRNEPAGHGRSQVIADLVNAFSPLALISASFVALTGATTAWLHLKRISALWTSSYGQALMVKLALVAVVVGLGAWNWRRVRPSLGDEGTEHRIQRSAKIELTFAALVLIATSVLVTLPSPR
jgi:copper transport protein